MEVTRLVVHIYLAFRAYKMSYNNSTVVTTGIFIKDGEALTGHKLADEIKDWATVSQWLTELKASNGFFALIVCKENMVYAATDRLRTIPLFYSKIGNEFYISDSSDWICEQVNDHGLDTIAKEEFLLTGYVTGTDTLYKSVKQMQAGEFLCIQETSKDFEIVTNRYFQYVHCYPNYVVSENELVHKHDEVLSNIFKRLIHIAQGRTLVVPLSGGLDSRLIVLMLKRLKYEKVIAFSYGIPGNTESLISERVAKDLEIPWFFLPYSGKAWKSWYHSDEKKAYYQMSFRSASLPHMQDWPAVWQLKVEKRIPSDSIFVPGHSADLPAGSRSRSLPKLYATSRFDLELTIDSIIEFHYCLQYWPQKLRNKFRERILRSLGTVQQFPDSASAFESWDIAERQAKFILNSLRVYEFWGYDWWVPFWDYEYVSFWSKVPLCHRIGQEFYANYVLNLYSEVSKRRMFQASDSGWQECLKHSVSKVLSPYPTVKKLTKLMHRILHFRKEKATGLLGYYGIVPFGSFISLLIRDQQINSYLVRDLLNKN